MRRRLWCAGALVVLACGTVACGTVPAVVTPTRTPAPVPPSAPPTTAPRATASTQPSPGPLAGPVLTLAGDGLGLAGAPGERLTPLPFGSPQGAVLADLTGSLGRDPEEDDLTDCPQGPRHEARFEGFSVLFDGGRFVGWFDRGSVSFLLQTSDGLGMRSRTEDILAARPDVDRSAGPLGDEATLTDGLVFLLDGPGRRAVVTGTFAGQTCWPDR